MNKVVALLVGSVVILLATSAIAQSWYRDFDTRTCSEAYKVCRVSDGNFLLVGEAQQLNRGEEVAAIKMRPNGDTIWCRTFGTVIGDSTNYPDYAFSMVEESSGVCYLLTGSMNHQVFIAELDTATGMANHSIIGAGEARDIKRAPGGYIIIADSNQEAAYYQNGSRLIRVNHGLGIVWSRNYNGLLTGVISTPDNGFILSGWSRFGGNDSAFVIKTDSSGNPVWQRSVTGGGLNICPTSDGGCAIVGWIGSTLDSTLRIQIVRYSATGALSWCRSYGSNSSGNNIKQTSTGDFIVVAQTIFYSNTAILLKVSAGGDSLWQRNFVSADAFYGVDTLSDGFLISGHSWPNNGVVIRTDMNGNIVSSVKFGENLVPGKFKLNNYPNPFNSSTKITFSLPNNSEVKLAVYDITGRLVETLANGQFTTGLHSVQFNGTGLATGTYFVRMQTPSQNMTRKMLLVK